MSEARTYRFSESFIANRRRLLVILAIVLTGAVALSALAAADFDLQRIDAARIGVALAMTAALLAIVFAIGFFVERGWRRFTLRLDDDGLVREAGATRQRVAWADVTALRVRNDGRGHPRLVEIFSRTARPMQLAGLDSMDGLVRALRARLPADADAATRRQWFDWQNLWVIGGLFAAAALTGLAVAWTDLDAGGEAVRAWARVLWPAAMGAFFLLYAPMSRANPGFRTLEVVIGAGSIAVTLLGIALMFL